MYPEVLNHRAAKKNKYIKIWEPMPNLYSFYLRLFSIQNAFKRVLSKTLEFWISQIFEKRLCFVRNLFKSTKYSLFCTLRANVPSFGSFTSKMQEIMSLETHLATIITGSLSLGLINPWVIWTVDFFSGLSFSEKAKKEARFISMKGLLFLIPLSRFLC